MSNDSLDSLLAKSISIATVVSNGSLTTPRTWGVYQVAKTGRAHIGNHPVRLKELEREFGSVKQVALFLSRRDADALKQQLNHSSSKVR